MSARTMFAMPENHRLFRRVRECAQEFQRRTKHGRFGNLAESVGKSANEHLQHWADLQKTKHETPSAIERSLENGDTILGLQLRGVSQPLVKLQVQDLMYLTLTEDGDGGDKKTPTEYIVQVKAKKKTLISDKSRTAQPKSMDVNEPIPKLEEESVTDIEETGMASQVPMDNERPEAEEVGHDEVCETRGLCRDSLDSEAHSPGADVAERVLAEIDTPNSSDADDEYIDPEVDPTYAAFLRAKPWRNVKKPIASSANVNQASTDACFTFAQKARRSFINRDLVHHPSVGWPLWHQEWAETLLTLPPEKSSHRRGSIGGRPPTKIGDWDTYKEVEPHWQAHINETNDRLGRIKTSFTKQSF